VQPAVYIQSRSGHESCIDRNQVRHSGSDFFWTADTAGEKQAHPLQPVENGVPIGVGILEGVRGALAPVDADGRPLPFDVTSLDLPIVRSGGGGVADSGVFGLLSRVQAVDPALFQTIDAVRRTETSRGDVLLELGGGAHRVLLNRDAGPEVIAAVVSVARDLAAKARPYAELDARFAGQVVVRRRGARLLAAAF